MSRETGERIPIHRLAQLAAWAIFPIYVLGIGCYLWLEKQMEGINPEDFMLGAGFGAFALVGSVLVARRPANLVGWIMAAIGLLTALFPAAESYAAYVMEISGTPNALAVFGAWANEIYWVPLLTLAFFYLLLLFPDGHLISRRWLPFVILPGLSVLGISIVAAFRETLYGQNHPYQIPNPIGIPGMPPVEEHPVFATAMIAIAIGSIGAVISVFVRYRRSQGVERQQIKWFMYTAALLPLLYIPASLGVGDLLFGFVLVAFPTAIGIAILRYRLWDIDIIIRRTVLYAGLTALLGLVYFGAVIVLQELFGRVSGQENSPLAIVISTLAIAALFNPLRARLQNFIDRRFFRHKYNAEQAVEAFAAHARSETDLLKLTEELIDTIQNTLQPEGLSLWITEGKLSMRKRKNHHAN